MNRFSRIKERKTSKQVYDQTKQEENIKSLTVKTQDRGYNPSTMSLERGPEQLGHLEHREGDARSAMTALILLSLSRLFETLNKTLAISKSSIQAVDLAQQ